MIYPAVNLIPVVIGGAIHMALGMAWYSPLLFGNAWMKLIGLSKKDLEVAKKGGMAQTMGMTTIAALIASWVIGVLTILTKATTLGGGLRVGLLVSLLIFMAVLPDYLYGKKPMKLFLIQTGYQAVGYSLIALLFAVWR